jgi:hypothetical protein
MDRTRTVFSELMQQTKLESSSTSIVARGERVYGRGTSRAQAALPCEPGGRRASGARLRTSTRAPAPICIVIRLMAIGARSMIALGGAPAAVACLARTATHQPGARRNRLHKRFWQR